MSVSPSSADRTARLVWIYLIAALISLVGLADAIYLTVEHLSGESLRCTIISGCSEVLSSPYAHIGSVPLAAVGAAAYFTVFSFATLAAFRYAFAATILKIGVAMMFLTTLWLLYLQAFVIRHFCQYCLLSALVTFLLSGIVLLSSLTEKQR
jgi:uncharacterized membrane protein